MKKRLLKDLPFGNLNKGTVLTKRNGGYYLECGETLYKSGGSSHNGWLTLDDKECEIVNMIWDNEEWFIEATIKHIEIKATTTKIIIEFDPVDLGQAQLFAKGLQHTFLHYGEEKGSWNVFKDFTSSLS